MYALKRKGLIKELSEKDKKFLQITSKGQLERLFILASVEKTKTWDGLWRLIVFDIPENSREKRDKLRWLLKRNGFIKLQASVFISPYALNREALTFLNETGLFRYIRIIRANGIDDDKDLKKKFGLT
jgi:phenylacetic acid degradation operon negative regulatory protein